MIFFMFSYSCKPNFLWPCSREKDAVSPKDYLNYIYNVKPDNLKVLSFYQNAYLSLSVLENISENLTATMKVDTVRGLSLLSNHPD